MIKELHWRRLVPLEVHQHSAVPCLVTLRPLCDIFIAAPGADPKFLVSDTGQIFNKFSGSELCILVQSDTDTWLDSSEYI